MLARAYAENPSSHVAFIDESYLSPTQSARFADSSPFYIATAYIAPCVDFETIRQDLASIAGATFWHTTQAHRDGGGDRIRAFCDYIAAGSDDEHVIVAAMRPVEPTDRDAENARSLCLRSLISHSHRGGAAPAVSLLVYEERKFTSQRNADERTITSLRRDGFIARNTRVFGASPAYESMLWLPDVVSFAEYQRHARSRFDYGRPFADRIEHLPVTARLNESSPRVP